LVPVCKGHLWGYLDHEGHRICDIKYTDAFLFSEGRGVVELNGKFGYIDELGQERSSISFDQCTEFYNGYATVVGDGYVGIMNHRGDWFIPRCNK
ncbi:MAG: WG repeat-containing protein, partial [Clostridium sp.]